MGIPSDYIERCYAGWLGKIAGVRLGAPIENWSYDKIRKLLGENVFDYIVDYKDFAADDDTNGPMFFLRALEDYGCSEELTAEQIGKTWLNYTPYEHGFYWWGGYGISTEHTAYLNLRAGIPAPQSGSIAQNGTTVAEQIGGQIFIDTWGLVNPGNPQRAARFARKAASVSHDGEGIHGGMFVAACIAAAFTASSMDDVINAGLAVIPADSEYARMARDVIHFHKAHPENWRDCFDFIFANYGYDRYPGICHIIPNSAVMILSLLYGDHDYTKTIGICNMCGWDTDCTTGNVGTIMGVFCGLEAIDTKKWFAPIHDFLACSSVMGSMNIMDVPENVLFMARIAYKLNGEAYPEAWADLLNGKGPKFHFQLPESTHSIRVAGARETRLTNVKDRDGRRCLQVLASAFDDDEVEFYHQTYYRPKDFHDSRYDPAFSPILYPGQRVVAHVRLDELVEDEFIACAYVLEGNEGKRIVGPRVKLTPGVEAELTLDIPALDGGVIERAGVLFQRSNGWSGCLAVYLLDMDFQGSPDYKLSFSREREEVWYSLHREISQMTRLKGLWYLQNGMLHGSGNDYAEVYTGDVAWKDYQVTAVLHPVCGEGHQFMARVQGACRSYAVRLCGENQLALLKNEDTRYRCLTSVQYPWKCGESHTLTLKVMGNVLTVYDEAGKMLIEYADVEHPYLHGCIGVGTQQSHCAFESLKVVGTN